MILIKKNFLTLKNACFFLPNVDGSDGVRPISVLENQDWDSLRHFGSLLSISPSFYEQLFCQFPFTKKIANPNCKRRKAAQNVFVRKSCS